MHSLCAQFLPYSHLLSVHSEPPPPILCSPECAAHGNDLSYLRPHYKLWKKPVFSHGIGTDGAVHYGAHVVGWAGSDHVEVITGAAALSLQRSWAVCLAGLGASAVGAGSGLGKVWHIRGGGSSEFWAGFLVHRGWKLAVCRAGFAHVRGGACCE